VIHSQNSGQQCNLLIIESILRPATQRIPVVPAETGRTTASGGVIAKTAAKKAFTRR
jgi:hypothetical protein